MPLLATLVLGLFIKLLEAFTVVLGRKVAVIAAAIAAVGTATLALTAATSALLGTILVAMPSGMAMAAWLFLPDNAGACVGAVIAVDSSCVLYEWYRSNLGMAAQIAGS